MAHCDWVGDSSAWNQVLLVPATSFSVEVKASGARRLDSHLDQMGLCVRKVQVREAETAHGGENVRTVLLFPFHSNL